NLNDPDRRFFVRHRVSIRYRRDDELDRDMTPLFMASANGLALLEGEDGYYNLPVADPDRHGPGCMIGEQAGVRVLEDRF
ncbi:MAG: hypothetical protein GWN79_12570, partial [Actinobacteria bacterium]|nr:hypothetical protein [Actinomycetota bacterium]NIS32281.1 hypothetical protein [Actinomycetota bacterium]NIT96189.1 hypothetical protein [Actinomycetota bacterium]NIU19874.1 hypothetical protein [Actinomycetota bacterium]NIU67323.1 hypothetical protein [Actinomycetota bacterium]